MSFMLALPKISLHGAGAIGDMVKLVAGKQWGKALIVTDGQLVKLGLLDSLFAALDEQQMAYQLFDEVFPNPTVMLDIPPAVTAATGMDALTHAIEAFVSVGAHPLTDANALEAIRLINLWLPKAVDDGHDLQAREQMAFGQYLAGMAFNSAGLGLVHALAHQPGATHNLPHGVCNAILLPIIENFNRPNAVARFARVAQAMGVDTRGMSDEAASMEAINAIRTLSKRVGIPQGFSQLGVSKADIEGWLDKALADPCAPCNPRPASRDEVRELYLEAL
ncbi:MAG: iron-containing alcohol dehydrogenase [Klebsiella pneumoniae]|nr:iron-containing alcohol dehydrogenase [Klebsiella pneumoniae]